MLQHFEQARVRIVHQLDGRVDRLRSDCAGGMLVAMPTAMPFDPLTMRLGMRVGKHGGLEGRLVVVRHEVDRLLLDVGEHFAGNARHAALGVAHRRRRIAVDRTEVSLAIDHRIAQAERLRQPHQGVVNAPSRRGDGRRPSPAPRLWRTWCTSCCAAGPSRACV